MRWHSYYDKEADVNRTFVSYRSQMGFRNVYKYYERIVFGKLSVLRTQKTFHDTIDETNPEAFTFYIEAGSHFTSLRSFRRNYFEQVKRELQQHMVSFRQYNPNTKHGALSLILLYNEAASSSIAGI
jgi:hypothetical protein